MLILIRLKFCLLKLIYLTFYTVQIILIVFRFINELFLQILFLMNPNIPSLKISYRNMNPLNPFDEFTKETEENLS